MAAKDFNAPAADAKCTFLMTAALEATTITGWQPWHTHAQGRGEREGEAEAEAEMEHYSGSVVVGRQAGCLGLPFDLCKSSSVQFLLLFIFFFFLVAAADGPEFNAVCAQGVAAPLLG